MLATSDEARFKSARVMLADVSTKRTAPTFVRGKGKVGSASAMNAEAKLAAFSTRGSRRAVERQL